MDRYLSLANGASGKCEIYKIIVENETEYTLNTGKRIFKDDKFINLITKDQVENIKYRNDVVLMF